MSCKVRINSNAEGWKLTLSNPAITARLPDVFDLSEEHERKLRRRLVNTIWQELSSFSIYALCIGLDINTNAPVAKEGETNE